ncbi:MAG TPA: c-type cytochrome [Burkholderiales bacterium]|nr:c-type cytochrome [Burkholderiales bacterium]
MAQPAGGDAVAGKRKTVTCNACHGVSGFKSMPKLGGQTAGYVIEALQAYKTGKRSHPTMRDVAGALSERDIADLAAHYGGMPKAGSASAVPAPAVTERCAACHGAQGDRPAAPEVPIIAGQSAGYLEQTIREYRDGIRVHAVMQEQTRDLGDAEVAELAGFFAGRAALSVR